MSETDVGRRAAVDPRSTAAGTASPAGILVPGYELIAELGHGAATVVYRARRASGDPGPDVALKMVREPTDDPAVAVAFRREAALLARAAHPCLGAVHAVGEAGGRPYLVLELVEGVALARLIEEGGLPDDRVVQVGIDAADALAAAHRMRLVHRDVKPQNLLVSDSGRTRLIDFDLATWTDELAPADSVAGTLTYSAPEQTGMLTRPVDARTDLYALGVVLFECVTGRPPFASPDVGELLRLHAVEPPPDVRDVRPECSAALAAVIAKLLAKDPDDRYQSAIGLLGDLRRVQAHAGDGPFTLDLDSAGVLAHGSAPPLIGREAELAQLTRRWRDASSRGGAVLLEGHAGEGRTRLATELLGRVTAEDGCALAVRCSPDDPQSLGAIGSAVQRHIEAAQQLPPQEQPEARERMRLAAGAAAALLATLSPTVAAVLGADGTALVGADRQEQIPTAIATFLVALARMEGRLLLVIDDAHQIDTLSERVLSHLRLNDEDAPLLVVSTAQTAGMASPTPGAGVPFDRRIPLGPLDPPVIKELIASELGGADVPDDVAGQLAARTGGNPFAILEYLRYLIEAGGLQPSWGTWLLDRELLDRLHLPSDVLDLVLARMEGLGATPRRVLAAAAVQGMRFDVTVIASTGAAAPDEIAVAIASATRRRMVEHVSGDVYAFVHAELRDALLADLGEAGIADQHRRIAEALDARPETGTEHIHALARHWMAAGVASERAYVACAAAGRTALAQHAPDDAVEFLSGAVSVAARAGIAVDVPLRRSHATALLRAGDFDGAIGQLNDALAVEQHPLRRAELMNLLAIAEHSAGEGERAIATIRRGLAEVGAALPRSLPLLMFSTIARFVVGLAVGAARGRLGRATGVRLQRYALEASLLETGMYAASVVVNDRMLVVFLLRGLLPANRIGHSPERVRSLAGLGYLAGMAGMPRLGLRVCGAAERAAADLGDPTLVALASWMRGVVGSIATARIAPVADALDAHGRWLDLPYYLAAVAGVVPQLVGVGYTSVAEMWVGRARKRLRLGGSAREAFPIECMAGAIQAVRGRATDADDTLQAARAGVDGDLTVEQRLHLAWAKLIILTEQGEFGDAFDEVATAIDAARMPAGNHITIAMRYTVTFGRLAQAHAATGADRQHRLAQARDGIRALRRARHQPRLHAGRLMFRAWALLIAGRTRGAQRMLHRALRAADGADAPQLSFDLMVVHARILRALRLEPEAQRQATSALMLAGECGWVYRARWIRDEFGLRDGADGTRRSLLHSSGPGSSAGHTGIHQRRRLEAVTQVSAAAASVLDPEELIRVALEVTMRLLSAERIFVFIARRRPDTADTVLVPHSGRDVDGNHLTELTNYSSTLVDRVWKSGEALVVTGTEHGAALGSESAVVHGLRSILVAPLQLKGRVLGVIYLDSRVARGIFAGDDADLLVTITQQVSASLETARAAQLEVAVRAANQQRDLAETLRASMADLNSTLDPEEVLHRLLQVVGTTLPGERAVLLRHGHDEMRLVAPPGHASHHAGATELVVALDDDTTLAALGAIDAPVVGGGGTPPHLSDRVSQALGQPRSWLAIPVLLRQQSTGVVIVGSAQAGSYNDVHVEVAAALAEQGAVAYENARLFSRVEELATTDGLTSLATRHHFWQLAEEQLALVARDRRPLAAIMLDIDHFKLVNDTHGHAAGDAVLREVADRLRALTGAADIIGRYGGEEFALIVPDTSDAGGYAERLRAAVAGASVPAGGVAVPVTISVGVSYHRAGDDLDALFGRADGALYRSKADGRNRVTVA